MTDRELKKIIKQQVLLYQNLGNTLFRTDFKIKEVNFKLKNKEDLGEIYLQEETISFNLRYARENLGNTLFDTVPHEVAHYFDYLLYCKDVKKWEFHGVSWQKITKLLTGKVLTEYN